MVKEENGEHRAGPWSGRCQETKSQDLASPSDIRDRAFRFAVSVVRLCRYLERFDRSARPLFEQLLRSGTSIGANLEEAKAGQSRADFVHKNAIALKEARESVYWLRLIIETAGFDAMTKTRVEEIKNEGWQIALIVGKIIVNARRSATD